MKTLNDLDRAAIVHQYRTSGETQEAFCLFLEITQGVRLSPRTLREWGRRFGQPRGTVEECIHIVSEAISKLQSVLEAFQAAAGESLPTAVAAAVEVPPEAARPISTDDALDVLPPGCRDSAAGGVGTQVYADGAPVTESDQPDTQLAAVETPQEPPPVKRKRRIDWSFG